jgi:hypothetical protein
VKRLAKEWLSYRAGVMHPNCHATQVIECRRAFYAGMAALAATLTDIADTATEAKDTEDILNELIQFQSDVKEGRA